MSTIRSLGVFFCVDQGIVFHSGLLSSVRRRTRTAAIVYSCYEALIFDRFERCESTHTHISRFDKHVVGIAFGERTWRPRGEQG